MTEEQGAAATNGSKDVKVEDKEEPKQEVFEKEMKEETKDEKGETEVKKEETKVKKEEPKVKKDETKAKSEKPTDLEEKIIRQIEYYFGDINLGKDKFLREQIKEDDGWVSLETMLKFNRLASLSKDALVITDALEKADSGLMEVSEDKSKIRRSPNKPLPEMNENRRKELMVRTLYVKGFPREEIKMDNLIDYFQQYGKVDNIVMRHYHDKAAKAWVFKGSAFVIFNSVEGADAFLKLESVKYEDTELLRMWQNDYIEKKRKERLEGKMRNVPKTDEGGKGDDKEEKSTAKPKEKERELLTGCLARISDLKPDTMRENIKKAIEEFGFPVAFVDFKKGDDNGWVRLDEQDSAKQLVKKLEEEGVALKVGDSDIKVEALNEEEEKAYGEKLKQIFERSRNMGKPKKRGGRFGGRGRGGWNMRKRKGSPSEEGPTPAKVKAESEF